jgi:hypothetical protein
MSLVDYLNSLDGPISEELILEILNDKLPSGWTDRPAVLLQGHYLKYKGMVISLKEFQRIKRERYERNKRDNL